MVIPARVLLNWDFEPRPVAQASKQYLKLMLRKPAIHVEAVNPHLFSLVEELAIVKVSIGFTQRCGMLLLQPTSTSFIDK